MCLLSCLALCLSLACLPVSAERRGSGDRPAPTPEPAAEIFHPDSPVLLRRIDVGVPGWEVVAGAATLGHIGSTWEIAGSVGYSGQPLDVLVGLTTDGVIAGGLVVQHNEPALMPGISDAGIAAYVAGFAGYDVIAVPGSGDAALPDVISRATVSTGVIRDCIQRTARTLATGRGIVSGGGVDRLTFAPLDWAALEALGALPQVQLSMTDAAAALAGATVPVEPGEGAFVHMRAAIADPPTIGQNLLRQVDYTRAIGVLAAGETALVVMSQGMHYCGWLCPFGALQKLTNAAAQWLGVRQIAVPQALLERLCETKCTVGAIDTLGRINPNECVLCLRCQVIMNDCSQCPLLKRRARTEGATA